MPLPDASDLDPLRSTLDATSLTPVRAPGGKSHPGRPLQHGFGGWCRLVPPRRPMATAAMRAAAEDGRSGNAN